MPVFEYNVRVILIEFVRLDIDNLERPTKIYALLSYAFAQNALSEMLRDVEGKGILGVPFEHCEISNLVNARAIPEIRFLDGMATLEHAVGTPNFFESLREHVSVIVAISLTMTRTHL